MTDTQRWPGFNYEPVRGLTDRILARYLRTQRKNMRRFFTERGLLDLTERMQQIRKSRQGMMAKNVMFQEVLDAYIKRATPQPTAQAEDKQTETDGPLAVHDRPGSDNDGIPAASSGSRDYPSRSVPELATEDSGSKPVIE